MISLTKFRELDAIGLLGRDLQSMHELVKLTLETARDTHQVNSPLRHNSDDKNSCLTVSEEDTLSKRLSTLRNEASARCPGGILSLNWKSFLELRGHPSS